MVIEKNKSIVTYIQCFCYKEGVSYSCPMKYHRVSTKQKKVFFYSLPLAATALGFASVVNVEITSAPWVAAIALVVKVEVMVPLAPPLSQHSRKSRSNECPLGRSYRFGRRSGKDIAKGQSRSYFCLGISS